VAELKSCSNNMLRMTAPSRLRGFQVASVERAL